jgi:hypothetical protein
VFAVRNGPGRSGLKGCTSPGFDVNGVLGVLGPNVESCVLGFEGLLSLGEDKGRLEMGWEASASFGEIVAALTLLPPAVELGSQLRKQNLYQSLEDRLSQISVTWRFNNIFAELIYK